MYSPSAKTGLPEAFLHQIVRVEGMMTTAKDRTIAQHTEDDSNLSISGGNRRGQV